MTTSRSEQPCFRGCVAEGRHYAECESYGVEGGTCAGCAPAAAYKETLVCETCYRRVRGILRNAPDLLGRLRSLAEQGKAVAYSHAKVPGRPAAPPQQIDDELLDAITDIEARLRRWYQFIDPRSLDGIDDVLDVPEWIESLWDDTLDQHPVDDDGIRHAWSLADAAARWGIERRDRHAVEWSESPDRVEVRMPVHEWGDRLLTKSEAERAAGSPRTLRRWVKDGLIAPEGRMVIAGVATVWYRGSDLLQIKTAMADKSARTRFTRRTRREDE